MPIPYGYKSSPKPSVRISGPDLKIINNRQNQTARHTVEFAGYTAIDLDPANFSLARLDGQPYGTSFFSSSLTGGGGSYTFEYNPYQPDSSAEFDTKLKLNAGVAGLDYGKFDGSVRQIIYANNSIYACGAFTSYDGVSCPQIVKLKLTGEIDTTFNTGAGFGAASVFCILVSGSDLWAGGNFTSYNGTLALQLVKINANTGAIDAGFVSAGLTGGEIYCLALADINTTLVVGGSFSLYGGNTRQNIFKCSATSGVVTAAFDSASGFNGFVNAIVPDPANLNIYVGGAFTTYKGTARQYIAKLSLSNAALDATFNSSTGFNNQVNCLLLSGTSLYVGGSFTSYKGSAPPVINGNNSVSANAARIAKIDSSTAALDTNFNTCFDGTVLSISLHSGGPWLFVGGQFTLYGGEQQKYLSRISSVGGGSSNLTFNVADAFDSAVRSTLVIDNSVFAAGDFTQYQGFSRKRICKLSALNSIANLQVFDPLVNEAVYSSESVIQTGTFAVSTGGGLPSVAVQAGTTPVRFSTTPASSFMGVPESYYNTLTGPAGGTVTYSNRYTSTTNAAGDVEGDYTIRYTAKDYAGGTVTKDIILTTILNAPTVTLGTPAPLTTNGNNVSIPVTFSGSQYSSVSNLQAASSYVVVTSNEELRKISSNQDGSFLIDASNNGWSWGLNYYGMLGNNTTSLYPRSSPASIIGGIKFKKIVSNRGNQSSVVGLDVSGFAWAWGQNFFGALGDGTTSHRSSPVSVLGGRQFSNIDLDAGVSVIALDNSGFAWTWGQNSQGELGDGTFQNRSSPVSVLGNRIFKQAQLRSAAALALDFSGFAWSWGRNDFGQLGTNSLAGSFSPVSVVGGLRFNTISPKYNDGGNALTVLVLDTSNYAWSWGLNEDGIIGDGTTNNRSSPTSVLGANRFFQVFNTFRNQGYGLTYSNFMVSWGRNSFGNLGDNTTFNKSSPVSVVGNRQFTQFSASDTRICALDISGFAWAWGLNLYGLGDGTTAGKSSPVSVLGGRRYSKIYGGDNIFNAFTSTAVWQWGPANNGFDFSISPVSVAGSFANGSGSSLASVGVTGSGSTRTITLYSFVNSGLLRVKAAAGWLTNAVGGNPETVNTIDVTVNPEA